MSDFSFSDLLTDVQSVAKTGVDVSSAVRSIQQNVGGVQTVSPVTSPTPPTSTTVPGGTKAGSVGSWTIGTLAQKYPGWMIGGGIAIGLGVLWLVFRRKR